MHHTTASSQATSPGILWRAAAVLLGVVFFLFAPIVGFATWPVLLVAHTRNADRIVLACAWIGALAVVAIVLVAIVLRVGSKRAAIAAAALAVLWGVVGVRWGTFLGPRMQCGAWQFKQAIHMRSLVTELKRVTSANEASPPSALLPVLDWGSMEQLFSSACGPCGAGEVRIGSLSFADYLAGRVTRVDLEREAERVNAGRSWEELGPYVFCLDPRALGTSDSTTIVGFVDQIHAEGLFGHDEPHIQVVYADCHLNVLYIETPEDRHQLRAELSRLAALGVPPPPKLPELLEQFDRSHP